MTEEQLSLLIYLMIFFGGAKVQHESSSISGEVEDAHSGFLAMIRKLRTFCNSYVGEMELVGGHLLQESVS